MLIWQLFEVIVERSGVSTEFIIVIIVGIALVIAGGWLAKGGKVSITE